MAISMEKMAITCSTDFSQFYITVSSLQMEFASRGAHQIHLRTNYFCCFQKVQIGSTMEILQLALFENPGHSIFCLALLLCLIWRSPIRFYGS